ncbi:MAG: NAD-dependent epimerase/dehydratase family protein [Burkholderiales bacterium]|nr:NAD-dependent epimerase/dehydratase family protein [Burkholderiales bacterium]
MHENIKNLKILVTGATGYIGSELVTKLTGLGCSVAVIKRASSNLTSLNHVLDKISIYECDSSTESVIKIVKDCNPDVVVHLASLFIAEHKSADIESLIASNLLFSTQIVEAMKHNNVKFLVNTGTSWEHFNNSKYNPVCLYAATKHAFESILEYYVQTSDLRVITLKLFDTYGPRDTRPKLIPFLQKLALTGEKLAMSKGEQLIDIVYIDDVIEAFLLSMKRLRSLDPKSNESYAVSSSDPITLKDLVLIFEEASGLKMNINWGMREYRAREVMIPWNDGYDIPGWRPEVGLLEGLSRITGDN